MAVSAQARPARASVSGRAAARAVPPPSRVASAEIRALMGRSMGDLAGLALALAGIAIFVALVHLQPA
jgi:hypothetical protein